jgi:hypothetical protein
MSFVPSCLCAFVVPQRAGSDALTTIASIRILFMAAIGRLIAHEVVAHGFRSGWGIRAGFEPPFVQPRGGRFS